MTPAKLRALRPEEINMTLQRATADSLIHLREDACYVDGTSARAAFAPATPGLNPPLNFTSVEAMVMEVSDLAQAYGYITALVERDRNEKKR